MKTIKTVATLMAAAAVAPAVHAVQPAYADTMLIPERSIVLSGDSTASHSDLIAVLYSREDLAYNDPSAPRFLFLDRKGKIAMGIGGYVLGTASYDMNGAIDGTGFTTYDIPTPMDPAQRNRLGADLSHTTLFLSLATHNEKVGDIKMYIKSNFTGNNGGYGFKLKQAWVSVGHVTAGLAPSTFQDGASQAPTIDSEGPSGQVGATNLLVRYKTKSFNGFSAAISAEMPDAEYTLAPSTTTIAQRVPDIPIYLQYAWGGGDNHIRLSGILRELSYRDTAAGRNHFVTGLGGQLSGVSTIYGPLGVFGHVAYGKGIAEYINDFSGNGFDLVDDGTGKLKAPNTLGWAAGLTLQPNSKVLVSAAYSQARVYGLDHMPSDTYRYGQYATVTGYYNITPDLQVGLEYIWGRRSDYSGVSGHANRLEASVQYSF